MTDIHPDPRPQLQALRHEAYRRAASWLAILPHEWRPLDALARQIAPALGREYLRLTRRKVNLDPSGEAGRKLLAHDVLKRLVSAGICDTHTDSDGQKTFARVRLVFSRITALPAPAESRSLAGAVVTVRDLSARDRRRVAVIDGEGGNPWGLPDPMGVLAAPGGRGVVAVVGAKVVGYAVYSAGEVRSNEVFSSMRRLAVAAEWQRRGIGTFLLQIVESQMIRVGAAASPAGAVVMLATVPQSCLPVQAIYRGLGYAVPDEGAISPGAFGERGGYVFGRVCQWRLEPATRCRAGHSRGRPD